MVTTTDNSERGMKSVAITIINPRKEYWPSLGSKHRPPVSKSATYLWGLALEIKNLMSANALTLSQTTNFRLVQIERICRRQFNFIENGRKLFKQVENTVGK